MSTARRLLGAAVVLGAGAAAGYAAERALFRRVWRELYGAPVADDVPEGAVVRSVGTDDGATIHTIERGAGRPLVLLHGVTLSGSVWRHQLADLADRHRIITVDHRGHGRSTAGSGGLGIERLASDVLEVFEERDLRGAVLVGHSMGGMVALQALADHPHLVGDRVAGLVLASTLAAVAPRRSIAALLERPSQQALRLAARLPGGILRPSDLSYAVTRYGLGQKATPADVELTRSLTAAMDPATMLDLLPGVVRFDLRQSLAKLDLPTLVLVGSADRITPVAYARSMVRRLPRARLEVLPGCGHMPMLERRDEFNRLLTEFAAALP